MVDPVHMQNIVTRAPEVARVQRVQEGAPEAQSQVFAQELARETQRAEETVPSPPQSARAEWKKERRKREEERRGTSGDARKTREKQEVEKDLGHFIDTTA
ncbi:MAG: TetR family transcriptional regulator [Candidatus Caldatribacterium sp.]|nr:TetR family transcriptional regulator [Candidatus Caldatribacterium sp.]